MLKREWCVESNKKLPHLFISSKTATFVPEIAVEDLPLCRTESLVPEFAVEDLPLGRTLFFIMVAKWPGDERDLNFLTFILQLKKKNSKKTQPGN